MSFDRPNKPGPEPSTEPMPDRGAVVAACRQYLQLTRHNPDFAKEFVHQVAAPQGRYEGAHKVAVVGGSSRWEFPYLNRVLQSLDAFMRMSAAEQANLRAGIEGDGVPWRGEPLAQYLDVVEETGEHAQLGTREYLKRAKRKIAELDRRVIVR